MTLVNTHNRVMVTVPGVTKEVVELEMLGAVREFFKRSGVWHGVLTNTTTAAQTLYTLAVPAGRDIALIDQVFIDGVLMAPFPDAGRPYELGGMFYVFDIENNRLSLQDDPGAGGVLETFVWYRPTTLADVPSFAWENHEDALVAGTLSRLFMQAGKPYTNPAMASVNHRIFISGISQAKRRAYSSNTRSDIGWVFPLATRSGSLR